MYYTFCVVVWIRSRKKENFHPNLGRKFSLFFGCGCKRSIEKWKWSWKNPRRSAENSDTVNVRCGVAQVCRCDNVVTRCTWSQDHPSSAFESRLVDEAKILVLNFKTMTKMRFIVCQGYGQMHVLTYLTTHRANRRESEMTHIFHWVARVAATGATFGVFYCIVWHCYKCLL